MATTVAGTVVTVYRPWRAGPRRGDRMLTDGTSGHGWRRSRRCQSNNGCVEVARAEAPTGPLIAIRDGTLPATGALALEPGAWRALLHRLKAGNLDLPTDMPVRDA
ncbi:DUF397 domain-containing protein [Actinomadura sp. SCN-SB]|uniref:DUF397 domain-containing protein n=1 Tax=Actinomadura sp. SCN-SB TaxID=3373092 RepID=UPI0037509B01